MPTVSRTIRKPAVELKGGMFTLTVLHLQSPDETAIAEHLQEKVSQAPDFFRNVPIVIDLQAVKEIVNVPAFPWLLMLLKNHGLIPVGLRNGSPEQEARAAAAGLAILAAQRQESDPGRSPAQDVSGYSPCRPVENPNEAVSKDMVVAHPIRSGQQVYAKGGDLVVLSQVSPGAELLADGDIHVYGALRGRALAGVKGNHQARIYCSSLEAELVSISGIYRVFEHSDTSAKAKPTQVYLQDEQLIIQIA
jgi:septum site-determining protein MinC